MNLHWKEDRASVFKVGPQWTWECQSACTFCGKKTEDGDERRREDGGSAGPTV
jgi:hypothetical protein